MTDATTPPASSAAGAAATPSAGGANAPQPAAPEPWKPEPHRWTWRDLFTAPMLAFKPACMLVSALMLLALGAWALLFQELSPRLGDWWWPVWALFVLVGLVVFGIGASFVAVFMKADALDDEFLSVREALQQWAPRWPSAVIVPAFLAVFVVGVHAAIIWLPMLIASIPYVGSALYALLYPFGFVAAVFAILLALVAALGLFVFPAIIAVRKHGWFDHVVDTLEAVGTRPHAVLASLALTALLIAVAYGIGNGAMGYLKLAAEAQPTWGRAQDVGGAAVSDELRRMGIGDLRITVPALSEPARAERRAEQISDTALSLMLGAQLLDVTGPLRRALRGAGPPDEPYYRWGTGLVLGLWQTLIGALILGYCLNLFIGGGLLTYLVVREDDYWDDENLEDLDKLAKELEEEAKREEQGLAPAAAPGSTAAPPAAGASPSTGGGPAAPAPPAAG